MTVTSPYPADDDPTASEPTASEPTTRSSPFFNLGTRDSLVRVALGFTFSKMNGAQRVEFFLSWIIVLALSYGLLLVVIKKDLRDKLGLGFVVFLVVCYAMIAIAVLAPYLSRVAGMYRTYYTALIPLSICLVIGLMDLAKRMRVSVDLLLALIIVPYFFCTTGLLHAFLGFSRH